MFPIISDKELKRLEKDKERDKVLKQYTVFYTGKNIKNRSNRIKNMV